MARRKAGAADDQAPRRRGRPRKDAAVNGDLRLPPDHNPDYARLEQLPWYTGADLPREEIDWLWEHYLPAGVPSLLYGTSNGGKSTVARYLAAAVTRGTGLPGMASKPPAPVLWFAAEEQYRSVVAPRLEAAGADMRLIHFPEELRDGSIRRLLLLEQGHKIQSAVERTGARLIVFDAIFDFAGGQNSPFSNETAQATMQALADLGRITGVGSLCIAFPKKGGRGPALEAVSGGMYWMNRARCALLNAPHATQPKVAYLIVSKPALDQRPPSLLWSLTKEDGLPRLTWQGETDATADTVAQPSDSPEEEEATADACTFLRLRLAEGPQKVSDLIRWGAEAGLSIHQLRRARRKLRVTYHQAPSGDTHATEWCPPEEGFHP